MPRVTTDSQVIEQRLDLEMLERPHLWARLVRGTRCVFLKRDALDQTGPCFQMEDGSYMVMAHDWRDGGRVVPLPYRTADAVLAAGWVVD